MPLFLFFSSHTGVIQTHPQANDFYFCATSDLIGFAGVTDSSATTGFNLVSRCIRDEQTIVYPAPHFGAGFTTEEHSRILLSSDNKYLILFIRWLNIQRQAYWEDNEHAGEASVNPWY